MQSTTSSAQKPITAIIVGAGHRSIGYADITFSHPDLLQIVGVADPNPVRRRMAMERYGFSEDMCFESAQQLASKGKLADTVINDCYHLQYPFR